MLIATASTNLHNMRSHPLDVLVVSAFWLSSTWLFWPMVLLVLVVMAPLERRMGTGRTVAVFAAGHVGATLLTVSGIALGVGHGWLPTRVAYAVDVGPSYGLAALASRFILVLCRPGVRGPLLALLAGSLVGLVWAVPGFTSVGHLVAAGLGAGIAAGVHRYAAARPVPATATEG